MTSHEISLASAKAAAAATPPIAMVCSALRAGPVPGVTALQISEDPERGQGYYRRVRQSMHGTGKKDVRRKRNQPPAT